MTALEHKKAILKIMKTCWELVDWPGFEQQQRILLETAGNILEDCADMQIDVNLLGNEYDHPPEKVVLDAYYEARKKYEDT